MREPFPNSVIWFLLKFPGLRSVFVVNVRFLTQTHSVLVMKKKKKKRSVFHGWDKEVSVGTWTALSLVLVKSLESQPSLAVPWTRTETGSDEDGQARGNGPVLQSQPWHREQRKTAVPFGWKNTPLAILLRNSEVILKTVLYKKKTGLSQLNPEKTSRRTNGQLIESWEIKTTITTHTHTCTHIWTQCLSDTKSWEWFVTRNR